MKTIRIFSTLLLLFGTCSIVNAQILKKAKNKTESKVNQKTDRGIDQALNKGFEGIGNIFKKKNKDLNQEEEDLVKNTEVEKDETLNSPNKLICSFNLEMEVLKKGKIQNGGTTKMTVVLDEWQSGMNITTGDGQKLRYIHNRQEGSIILQTNEMVQAIKMRHPGVSINHIGKEETPSVTRTDEIKTIDGYTCRKYLFEDCEQTGTAWITEEHSISFDEVMAAFNMKAGKKNALEDISSYDGIKGFPIESHTVSKNGKEEVKMRINTIVIKDIDRKIFDTTGLTIMNMGGF